VLQQLTQLGHTDSAVGAPKFTKVQIFPTCRAGHGQGGLLYVSDLYAAAQMGSAVDKPIYKPKIDFHDPLSMG